jgi:zinc and cadmium transporter
MSTLGYILGSGILMSLLALVGSATVLLGRETLERIVKPLVTFAAGSLLGGAFFHVASRGDRIRSFHRRMPSSQ